MKNEAPKQPMLEPFETTIDFPIKETVSSSQIQALLGLKDYEIRNLAKQINPMTDQPWIPKPRGGRYVTVEILRGVFDYQRWRSKTEAMPIYPSMEAMSVDTGIPKLVLQYAKRSGCRGFRHSRCYPAEIIPWLFRNNSPSETADWTEHHAKFRALNEHAKFRNTMETMILKGVAKECADQVKEIWFRILSELERDLPIALAGCNAHLIQEHLSKVNNAARATAETEILKLEDATNRAIEAAKEEDEFNL